MFAFVLCFWNVIKKCPPILVSWRISLYFLISGLGFPGADWMRGERDPLWLLYVWASGSHSTDYRRLSSPQDTLSAAWRKSLAVDAWASRPALTVVCLSAVCCACHCNYCGFGLCETKQCNASCFVLFVQGCFGNQPFFRDTFLRSM